MIDILDYRINNIFILNSLLVERYTNHLKIVKMCSNYS